MPNNTYGYVIGYILVFVLLVFSGSVLVDTDELYAKEKYCWERGGKLVKQGKQWACATAFIDISKVEAE